MDSCSLCWTLVICMAGVHLAIAQDNEWGSWSPYKRLNECLCLRTRTCYSAEHQCLKEENCEGNSTEIRTCMTKECQAGGGLRPWSPWSPCSASCGPGVERRLRPCRGGAPCPGDGVETRPCMVAPCPLWDEWSQWSHCSAKRDGTRHRSRKCRTIPDDGGLCWEKQRCNLCPHMKMALHPAEAKMQRDGQSFTFHCQYSSPVSDSEGVTIEMTTIPKSSEGIPSSQLKFSTCGLKLKWTTQLSRGTQFVVCVARNEQGDVISKMAAAILAGDQPVLRVPRSHVLAHAGTNATLQCQVTKGAVGSVMRWGRVDGRPLPHHADNQTNGHLLLHTVALADGGDYICHAENGVGITRKTVTLEVVTKPNITITPSNFMAAYANHTLTVECLADSHPKPSVGWYKTSVGNGSLVPLPRENRTVGGVPSSRLVFNSLRREDEGNYVCVAVNKHAGNKATLFLIVNDFNLQPPPPAVTTDTAETVVSTSSALSTVTTVAKPSEEPGTPNIPSVSTTTSKYDTEMSMTTSFTPSTVSASTTVPTTSTATETTAVEETSVDPPVTITVQPSLTVSPDEETAVTNNEISVCPPKHMRCANARCVPRSVYCNDVDDCGDNSDEWNCQLTRKKYPCGSDEFLCSSYIGCIPSSFVCDVKEDCLDGSDEQGCNPAS